MNESQTPRCDAMMKYCFGDDREFVPIEKARELETELAATRARLVELEERLKENMEREDATERELCRVSDVACDRAIKLAELEGIADGLALDLTYYHNRGRVIGLVSVRAYEAYKEGKK